MRTVTFNLVAAVACALLAACGGGSGTGGASVASAPAPLPSPSPSPTTSVRTPLPATPATTTGSYEAISTFTSMDFSKTVQVGQPDGTRRTEGEVEIVEPLQIAPAGSVKLDVDAATRRYTLTVTAGPYPFPSATMTLPADTELGYTRNNPSLQGAPADWVRRGDMIVSSVPAGTSASGAQQTVLSFIRLHNAGQIGDSPRYLSAAVWGQFYQENPSGIPGPENVKILQETQGLMVFGQRTAPDDMPATGRASYALRSFLQPTYSDEDGNTFNAFGEGTLDIDFATKRLSGRYDWSATNDIYETDDEGYALTDDEGNPLVLGRTVATIRTTGSTLVANDGSFNLGLAGTGTLQAVENGKPPIADIVKPVAGTMNGAFFGPRAAEVGGIADLPRIGSNGEVFQSLIDFTGTPAIP
jgi:hypothetical protein